MREIKGEETFDIFGPIGREFLKPNGPMNKWWTLINELSRSIIIPSLKYISRFSTNPVIFFLSFCRQNRISISSEMVKHPIQSQIIQIRQKQITITFKCLCRISNKVVFLCGLFVCLLSSYFVPFHSVRYRRCPFIMFVCVWTVLGRILVVIPHRYRLHVNSFECRFDRLLLSIHTLILAMHSRWMNNDFLQHNQPFSCVRARWWR